MRPSRPLLAATLSAALLCGTLVRADVDEHAHHHAMMAQSNATFSAQHYAIPNTLLQDELGKLVKLRELLNTERPVVMNFIYTSCTTICPVMTSTLLQMQKQIPAGRQNPLFVSISVDPDFDSPQVLRQYASRFGADWTFLTGPQVEVIDVLKSLDAWRGTKANHAAITLLRAPGSDTWTRVEGLASAGELIAHW
jgi:protein SCO1